jgi:hypothetical protein
MNPQLLAFLAIPALLERGVAALERIAYGSGNAQSSTPQPNVVSVNFQQPAPEPEAEDTPAPAAPAKPAAKRGPKAAATPAGPSTEEMMSKIMDLVTPAMEKDPGMGSKFVAVVQKHGGTRFTDIPAANLPAALADVEALCEGSVNSAAKLF